MANGVDQSAAGGSSLDGRAPQPQPPVDMSATSAGFDFLGDDAEVRERRPAETSVHSDPAPGGAVAPSSSGRRAVAQGHPRHGRATVVGQVRGIQQRTEGYGEHGASVLTFRVERYDDAGNRLQPVPVQLRARGYDGSLNEGDNVRVSGRWKDGTLHTSRVRNLTTGASVAGKSIAKMLLIFLAIFLAVAAALVIALAAIFIGAGNAFQDDVNRKQREFQEQVDQRDRDSQEKVDEQRRLFCERAKQNGATPPGC